MTKDIAKEVNVLKEITVFEGWFDQTPGWEFDMPVYMVHPIGMYTEAGNASGVDQLIEDYIVDKHCKLQRKDYLETCDPKERRWIKSMFTRAKNNKARSGVFYWKRVVEWDPDDENCPVKYIEEVNNGKLD